MIVKLFLFSIFLLIFKIFYFVNGNSLEYLENLKHTERALRVMADMSRRLRRQSIRTGLAPKKSFNAVNAWKRGFTKMRIVNIMKNPYFYQGDVLFTKIQATYMVEQIRMHLKSKNIRYPSFFFQNSTRMKRRAKSSHFLKWDLPIPVFIHPKLHRQFIERSLAEIQHNTCIRFKKAPQPIDGYPGISFLPGTGCSSYVGKAYDDKFQEVIIGEECYKTAIIQHEVLHTLGFFHEQSRYDRDKYVQIVQQNISPNKWHNFDIVEKEDSKDYGLPYDYASIMHYPLTLFSVNNQPTTFPKDKNYILAVGVQEKLTFTDIKYINLHYCSRACPTSLPCGNWGYQDPNNCNQCICPPGFNGRNCGTIGLSARTCGETVFKASENVQGIYVSGVKICHFMIQAPQGTRIAFKMVEGSIYPNYKEFCTYDNTIEIKYWKDKSVSGARYCHTPMDIPRFAQDNLLEIIYRSNDTENYAYLVYKAVTNF